jgi:transposase
MKALRLRAVVLARRRATLAESTRRSYLRKLDRSLNAIMVLAPTNRDRRRLRKRYGAVRGSLFTFLEHPDVPPDNNGSERELRPTARLPADSGHSGATNFRQYPLSGPYRGASWN